MRQTNKVSRRERGWTQPRRGPNTPTATATPVESVDSPYPRALHPPQDCPPKSGAMDAHEENDNHRSQELPPIVLRRGIKVIKRFDEGHFIGEIVDVLPPEDDDVDRDNWYEVKYRDGDRETLEQPEALRYASAFLARQAHQRSNMAIGRPVPSCYKTDYMLHLEGPPPPTDPVEAAIYHMEPDGTKALYGHAIWNKRRNTWDLLERHGRYMIDNRKDAMARMSAEYKRERKAAWLEGRMPGGRTTDARPCKRCGKAVFGNRLVCEKVDGERCERTVGAASVVSSVVSSDGGNGVNSSGRHVGDKHDDDDFDAQFGDGHVLFALTGEGLPMGEGLPTGDGQTPAQPPRSLVQPPQTATETLSRQQHPWITTATPLGAGRASVEPSGSQSAPPAALTPSAAEAPVSKPRQQVPPREPRAPEQRHHNESRSSPRRSRRRSQSRDRAHEDRNGSSCVLRVCGDLAPPMSSPLQCLPLSSLSCGD